MREKERGREVEVERERGKKRNEKYLEREKRT